jgi:hypothetical protein
MVARAAFEISNVLFCHLTVNLLRWHYFGVGYSAVVFRTVLLHLGLQHDISTLDLCFVTKLCDDKDIRLLRKSLKMHFFPS